MYVGAFGLKGGGELIMKKSGFNESQIISILNQQEQRNRRA